MKQYANNACGTVGVLHAFMNLVEKCSHLIQKDSFLEKFYIETKDKDPDQRGHHLVQSKDLEVAHKEAVEKGVKIKKNLYQSLIKEIMLFFFLIKFNLI